MDYYREAARLYDGADENFNVFGCAGVQHTSVPVTIKVAATVMLSIFFSLINPPVVTAQQDLAVQAIFLLGCEATYGLALGAIASVLFATVKLAAE
jgi:flagellar biosynthesis protein FliR